MKEQWVKMIANLLKNKLAIVVGSVAVVGVVAGGIVVANRQPENAQESMTIAQNEVEIEQTQESTETQENTEMQDAVEVSSAELESFEEKESETEEPLLVQETALKKDKMIAPKESMPTAVVEEQPVALAAEVTEVVTEVETETEDTEMKQNSNSNQESNQSSNRDDNNNKEEKPNKPEGDQTQEEYQLMWEDNFEGDTLNMSDWNYEYHEPGWVNNELQKYVDSQDNVYVKDGELVIQAIKNVDEMGNVSYTSGRVNTQNKHDFKYGKFEIRAKSPVGQGFLPAIWMMPTNESLYGQWPKCGEIDIMEVLGSQTNKTYGTLHFGEPHAESQGSYQLSEGDFSKEYHVYACEWEPGEIRFYVDGKLFHTENDWFTKKEGYDAVTYPAPFDQPFYLILNLAVGGNWPGNPDDTTVFDENATLRVDYVRVYQKDEYDENVTKPEKEYHFREPDENGNYIINGDFAQEESLSDGKNWEALYAGTGEGDAKISNGTLEISTLNPGNLDYSIQIVQAGLPMEQGYRYKLSFDAYADENRTMITGISAPDKGYKRYFSDTKVQLTTEKETYEYEFDLKDDSDENGRIEFNLGNQPSTATVYISNVKFEKCGKIDVVDEEKTVLADGNYVYNGEFQQGTDRLKYWTVETSQDDVKVTVTNDNNERFLKVDLPATQMQASVMQQVAITGDKKYTLTFDAYADAEKQINMKVAGEEFVTNLSTTKKGYKYTFDTEHGLKGAELEMFFTQQGIYYVDNVRIQEDALLINGDFSNGLTGYEVYAYTSDDVNYVVDSQKEDNAFSIDIKNTGDQDWKIQLKQNGITLKEGTWYKLSFKAKSSLDRKIMYALQRDGSSDDDWTPYSDSNICDLQGDYITFEKTFQMNYATDEQTILSISMGAVGGKQIDEIHTIVIDDISLEEVDEPKEALMVKEVYLMEEMEVPEETETETEEETETERETETPETETPETETVDEIEAEMEDETEIVDETEESDEMETSQ